MATFTQLMVIFITSFMDSKVHSTGFLKRPYLPHSVQMAGTGDFLKENE